MRALRCVLPDALSILFLRPRLLSCSLSSVFYATMAAKSSKAALTRHKRSRPKKGGKSGRKENFDGHRAEFCAEVLPGLIAIQGQPRHEHGPYWLKTLSAYWALFPWNLPLHVDPTEDTVDPTLQNPDLLKDEVLMKQKSDVVADIEAVSEWSYIRTVFSD